MRRDTGPGRLSTRRPLSLEPLEDRLLLSTVVPVAPAATPSTPGPSAPSAASSAQYGGADSPVSAAPSQGDGMYPSAAMPAATAPSASAPTDTTPGDED